MTVYADLYRYRELFGNLFRRDLHTRYKGSALGVVWSLLNPLILMGIYVLVFSLLWKAAAGIQHYALYLLVGLALAVLLQLADTAARSMVDSAALVKKVRFPRQLVPLSVVATQLVTFVGDARRADGRRPRSSSPRRATRSCSRSRSPPRIVAFVAGVALIVACANVVFRDVEHLVQAVLLPWFFLTPILYRLEDLPGGVQRYDWVVTILRWVNPLTPPLYALRAPLFYGTLPDVWDVVYLVAEVRRACARRVGLQTRRRPHSRGALTAPTAVTGLSLSLPYARGGAYR